jgi:phenylpropionate dioxygenase-like ring-hydroxylating dioxygenase large terminal subunit
MSARYPFSPYPEGWYRIAWTRDLGNGRVLPLRWFGQDLVLYRGESGRPYLLDAHCPHVGAHLGHGGRVKGETIACPFHGWRMAGTGSCVLVPLAKKIPPRARVRTWPVCELSGAILAYVHPSGDAPRWYPDAIEGWTDPEWTRAQFLAPWRVRTHVQELGENAVDLAHAVVLHDHFARAAETIAVESEGPILRHRSAHHYKVFALVEWLGRKVVGTLDTRCDGLGRIVIHARVDAGIQIEHRIVFYPTPVDDDVVELHAAVTLRRQSSWLATQLLLAKSVGEVKKTIGQDLPIWEHKRWEPRPLLVEGEQAVGHFRRWAKQFYAPKADAVGQPVADRKSATSARAP